MANESKVKFNMDNLNDLVKSLKGEYVLRVGILGQKAGANHDKESGLTNAELGTFHEFGGKDDKRPPRRSFLEDSLKLKLQFNSSQFSEMRKKMFKDIFQKHKPQQFLQDLGAKCLEIIEDGFASNGFGKWKPLSTPLFTERFEKAYKNYNRILKRMEKGKIEYNSKILNDYIQEMHNPHILTDTGKLRNSITFKVIKKK